MWFMRIVREWLVERESGEAKTVRCGARMAHMFRVVVFLVVVLLIDEVEARHRRLETSVASCKLEPCLLFGCFVDPSSAIVGDGTAHLH